MLHKVKVRLVTQKYLDRIAASKGETVSGCYVPDNNMIYLAKEQDPTALIHTLLHELGHVFEDHCARMEPEARADAFATLLMRIFTPKSIEELLIEPVPKKK